MFQAKAICELGKWIYFLFQKMEKNKSEQTFDFCYTFYSYRVKIRKHSSVCISEVSLLTRKIAERKAFVSVVYNIV